MKTIILGLISLGLSSAVFAQNQNGQYCDMKTETVVVRDQNGVLSERTVEVMKCNDNPIDRLFLMQSGMAANCGEFSYWMQVGGRNVQRKGVSCQKLDGSWEIVNTGRN